MATKPRIKRVRALYAFITAQNGSPRTSVIATLPVHQDLTLCYHITR